MADAITRVASIGGFGVLDEANPHNAVVTIGDNTVLVCNASPRQDELSQWLETIDYAGATVAADGTLSYLAGSAPTDHTFARVGSTGCETAWLTNGGSAGNVAAVAYRNDFNSSSVFSPVAASDIGLLVFALDGSVLRHTEVLAATVARYDSTHLGVNMPAVNFFADGSILLAWMQLVSDGGAVDTLELRRYTVSDPTTGALSLAGSFSLTNGDRTPVIMAPLGNAMAVRSSNSIWIVNTDGSNTRTAVTGHLPMTAQTQMAANGNSVIVAAGSTAGTFVIDKNGVESQLISDPANNWTPIMDTVGNQLLLTGQYEQGDDITGPASFYVQVTTAGTLIDGPQPVPTDPRVDNPYFALVSIRLLHSRKYAVVVDDLGTVYTLASATGFGGTTIEAALRLAQRNDGRGPFAHPRLRASANASTSVQSGVSPRVGLTNRYR